MYFKASKELTVLSESVTEDEFGDPVDDYQADRTGVPAHLWEESSVVSEPSEGGARTIRTIKALVKDDTAITKGERLKDEATGDIYLVLHVQQQHSLLGASLPQQLELEIVS